MDAAAFWKLIDTSRRAADGNPEEQLETLGEALEGLEPAEIVEFDRLFSEHHARAYSWDVWGAAYLIGGGCSDDGFMDFRGWLVSRGRKVYEAALADPDSLAKVVTEDDDDCQVEGFQYLAVEAWERKTGRPTGEYPRPSVEEPAEPTGTPWDEDELDARFPKLAKKFGV